MNSPQTILAIDAAWTASQPSGVALFQQRGSRWRCIALAPCYRSFTEQAEGIVGEWSVSRSQGSEPDIPGLLEAAERLSGHPPDLITIDIPIARTPFATRRAADRAVSRDSAAAIALPTHPPLHNQTRSECGSQRPCPRQDMNWRPRIPVRQEGANSWRYIRIRLCCPCCSVQKECPTRSASRKNTGAPNRWRVGSETSWSSSRLFGTRLARSSTD
jgi:hypothetical protein